MTRKLLPYEYDLIDALGVTKEEYFDFVAQQHIYEDIKQGTALDIRGAPVAILCGVGVNQWYGVAIYGEILGAIEANARR